MRIEKKSIIEQLNKIPPLSKSLQRVINLLNEDVSDWKIISSAMLQDPVLVGRILQIANSSFYGSQREVGSMERACQILGVETLRGLAYTLLMLSQFRGGPANSLLNYNLLWKNCLRVACLAKILAKKDKVTANVAFTAGMFHCMDIVIQDYFYHEILVSRIACSENTANDAASEKIAGIIDQEYWYFIEIILEYWQFPAAIVDVFRASEVPTAVASYEWVSLAAQVVNDDASPNVKKENSVKNENRFEHLSEEVAASKILYLELESFFLH
jgi:HD-like signal output (HDOD) protein